LMLIAVFKYTKVKYTIGGENSCNAYPREFTNFARDS